MNAHGRLRLAHLTYGFPQRVLGRDLSFELTPGEVLCVLGPNGCGKTTLFRTLLGLLAPQGGRIYLDDRPLDQWSRAELARVVGYVPQAHTGYFAFTVREVVLMGRTAHLGLFATPSRGDVEIAEHILHALGIAHLAEQAYTRISGGERQLTLIGRALAQQPRLLVLDEPTASLDFGNQSLVLNQITALARQGISILFSTHDPDQAFMCADRVLMLRSGHALCLGPPDDVLTPDNLRCIYGIDVAVVNLPELPGGGSRKTCIPVVHIPPSHG
jgi:iron complex transport system ATP-binding protein